jgi:Ala-tRNA(Pro) deacylase
MDIYPYLQKHRILYREYAHPAVFTVAESDKVTQHVPGMRTKNLFLRDEAGKFYLVCMPGHERLDLKSLKQYLKVKELKFGTPEELAAELHLEPGSVSPLAMIHAKNTKLLVDSKIWEAAEIGVHPNKNTATLVLTHTAFARFCATLSASWEVLPHA